jgi:hypothetical protein
MSSNATVSSKTFRDPTACVEMVLQANMAANDCGTWMYVGGYEKKTIHVIVANANVTMCGSNLPTQPDNANDDGVTLQLANGANAVFSANAIFEHKAPIKWIKAKVAVTGANASASAYLQGAP